MINELLTYARPPSNRPTDQPTMIPTDKPNHAKYATKHKRPHHVPQSNTDFMKLYPDFQLHLCLPVYAIPS